MRKLLIVTALLALSACRAADQAADQAVQAEALPAIKTFNAERVALYEDPETGCQYLVFTAFSRGVSVIPRIRPDAAGFVCDGAQLAEWQGEQD